MMMMAIDEDDYSADEDVVDNDVDNNVDYKTSTAMMMTIVVSPSSQSFSWVQCVCK